MHLPQHFMRYSDTYLNNQEGMDQLSDEEVQRLVMKIDTLTEAGIFNVIVAVLVIVLLVVVILRLTYSEIACYSQIHRRVCAPKVYPEQESASFWR